MGIIFTDNDSEVKLGELMMHRTLAALPVAGRYRMIDFVLSNMVNSGIINVGVTTMLNYQSLMDHIGNGKPWDLNRKQYGLFLLPPHSLTSDNFNTRAVRGRIDILHGAIDYIRKSPQRYAVLSDCHTVCNMDFQPILEEHQSRNADVTIVYKTVKGLAEDELKKSVLIDMDENQCITDIMAYPNRMGYKNVGMGIFIMERLMLERIVEDCVAYGEHDFVRDILIKNMNNLDMYGYKYEGYSCRIDSLRAYFDFSMNLLQQGGADSLFGEGRKVYTKVKDKVPTRYGEDAAVDNSMIADGCIIDGCVQNSILFRGVRVAKGTEIKNSIVMQDSEINGNSSIENSILDKEVIIKSGTRLVGHMNHPVVIGKGMIV